MSRPGKNGNSIRKQRAFGRVTHVHMVGIGGIGMSSIADVLLSRGFEVSGSDLSTSDITRNLQKRGARIFKGHKADQVAGADVVVFSSAVKPRENPETIEAERLHIPLIGRPEMLAELMRMKWGVGIAGTHGKTTTTSMAGLVVSAGGFDPTIIVGGKVTVFGSNAVTGEGDVLILEADEYDRTFLRLTPVISVITNIEEDHLDIYRDFDDIKQAFTQYANSVPFFGTSILCLDDPGVQEIIGDIHRPILTYGMTRQARVRAEEIRVSGLSMVFDVFLDSEKLGEITLAAPGIHNVRNALAAIAVGLELEIPFASIQEGLAQFSGVNRRFDVKGDAGGRTVVDDYAHHPTEVRVTLEAAHRGWRDRRIVVVFQPHLYSRTRDFEEAFARSFFNADVLVVTSIYEAREAPIEGVTGKGIADLAKQYGHREVHFVEDKTHLPDFLLKTTRPGDVVFTMGAGDVWRYGEAFLQKLREKDKS